MIHATGMITDVLRWAPAGPTASQVGRVDQAMASLELSAGCHLR